MWSSGLRLGILDIYTQFIDWYHKAISEKYDTDDDAENYTLDAVGALQDVITSRIDRTITLGIPLEMHSFQNDLTGQTIGAQRSPRYIALRLSCI